MWESVSDTCKKLSCLKVDNFNGNQSLSSHWSARHTADKSFLTNSISDISKMSSKQSPQWCTSNSWKVQNKIEKWYFNLKTIIVATYALLYNWIPNNDLAEVSKFWSLILGIINDIWIY